MIPYFQSTSYTTAASCLLTILHHFNKIPLTKEEEFKIWKETITPPTRASCIYALALYAQKQGLEPKTFVEKQEYSFPDYRFYRYTKEDIEHAAFSSKQYQKQLSNINVKQISLDFIKDLLESHFVIARLNTKPIRQEKRNTSNYIIITNYSHNYFSIIDPAFGCLSIPQDTLEEAFDSLETKKHRDHRILAFKKE